VWLQVVDNNNCLGRDTITVQSIKCIPQLYVPLAFTPGGDGRNDQFRPIAQGIFKSYVFTVFNRYGQRLFQSNELNKGWDGTYGNQPQNRGAYIWQCTYQGKEGPVKTEKGSFLLLR
jgi:gliding motility-associated-like protein